MSKAAGNDEICTTQHSLCIKMFSVLLALQRFAQSICFTVIKACFNMLRHLQDQQMGRSSSSSTSSASIVRGAEAQQVLICLGTTSHALSSSSPLVQDSSLTSWAQHALSVYRDMVTRGWRPTSDILGL
jgi:hypothetical protein